MSDQAIKELLELLPIPGKPAEEATIMAFIRRKLLDMGIPEEAFSVDRAQDQSEYGGETGNMAISLPGHGKGPRRMFSTHVDTVPDCVGSKPRLDEANDKIVNDAEGKGLGADDRTGCAVLLHVARLLAERKGDHPPTTILFLVQEEVGLVGSRGLDKKLLGDPLPVCCFNYDGGDPTEIETAVTGTERFTIDLKGVAAHAGGCPEKGVSCAVIAARAIAELESNGWFGRIEKEGKRGSANVGILQGGQGSNVMMPALHILAEARSHDFDFRKRIIEVWKEAFTRASSEVRNVKGQSGEVTFGPGPIYEAFAMGEDTAVVKTARAAATRCGCELHTESDEGGSDANWLVAHGVPTITLGAGQHDVHTPNEWVDLKEFRKACKLAKELALGEVVA